MRSRVVPPAPYVTDTYDGRKGSRSRNVCASTPSIFSSRGGKNSNEKLGPVFRISLIFKRFRLPGYWASACLFIDGALRTRASPAVDP